MILFTIVVHFFLNKITNSGRFTCKYIVKSIEKNFGGFGSDPEFYRVTTQLGKPGEPGKVREFDI